MRKGRGKDHTWIFYRYLGDCAIYAKCNCGFHYSCCKNVLKTGFKIVPDPMQLYNYCPNCGARKKWFEEKVRTIDKYPWE